MDLKKIIKNMFFKQYLNYLMKRRDNLYFYDKNEFRIKLLEAEKQLHANYDCNFKIVEQRNDIEPVVSVITPTYNSAQFLDELRQSLENQEIADKVQWIVVNDCSTDNTENVFHEFSRKTKLKSFKFISLDRNLGTSNALNIAADNSDSNILAWVSADDAYCDSKKLSTDLKMIENGYDCIFSRYVTRGPNLTNSIKIDFIHNKKFDSRDDKKLDLFFMYNSLIDGNIFNGSSSVFKKDLFFRVGGFDTNLGIFDQDGDLWEKFLILNSKIGLSQTCSFSRIHPNQNSRRRYEMTIFTNLVRVRMIKLIFDMNLNEHISYFEDEIQKDLAGSLFSYLISTNFFVKNSDILRKNPKIEYFMNFVKNVFEEDNIALLERISDEFVETKSFQTFLKNIQ